MEMTLPEVEGYIRHLREVREALWEACEGLPDLALNWKPPASNTNSIYALVTHMAGSEAWWIHQAIGGVDIGRKRDAEFVSAGEDLGLLKERFNAVAQRSEAVLRALSEADLRRVAAGDEERHTIQWCIVHVIEHLSLHVGHIELTRQWWEADQRQRIETTSHGEPVRQ